MTPAAGVSGGTRFDPLITMKVFCAMFGPPLAVLVVPVAENVYGFEEIPAARDDQRVSPCGNSQGEREVYGLRGGRKADQRGAPVEGASIINASGGAHQPDDGKVFVRRVVISPGGARVLAGKLGARQGVDASAAAGHIDDRREQGGAWRTGWGINQSCVDESESNIWPVGSTMNFKAPPPN
jgi:hypothetical protein